MNLDDTIVAIATPPGRGGIGVVRLAGTEARAIALTMLRLKHELEAGRAVFGELVDRRRQFIQPHRRSRRHLLRANLTPIRPMTSLRFLPTVHR